MLMQIQFVSEVHWVFNEILCASVKQNKWECFLSLSSALAREPDLESVQWNHSTADMRLMLFYTDNKFI